MAVSRDPHHHTHLVGSGQSPSGSKFRWASPSHRDSRLLTADTESSIASACSATVLGATTSYQVETGGFPETVASSLSPRTYSILRTVEQESVSISHHSGKGQKQNKTKNGRGGGMSQGLPEEAHSELSEGCRWVPSGEGKYCSDAQELARGSGCYSQRPTIWCQRQGTKGHNDTCAAEAWQTRMQRDPYCLAYFFITVESHIKYIHRG